MEDNHKHSPISSNKGIDEDKDFTTQKLNPKFDPLGDPGTWHTHLDELKDPMKLERDRNSNPFPFEVFPQMIQEIITATNESLNFPIDFIGGSLLFAVSVAIGNSRRIKIMTGYEENAVLYIAIVGRPGTNKSHPLSWAIKPIENHDSLKYDQYCREKKEYDEIASLSKKDKEKLGHDDLEKPFWQQHLVSDFTPEAIVDVHKYNPRGIGVCVDELASWFKNFNRYNKGSEEQFWLSNWSGKPIRINRKTSEPTYIQFPFISVAGTIQPGVIKDLAKDRTENGFLDRLLFVIPDSLKKEYWSEKELNPIVPKKWESIISKLLELPQTRDNSLNLSPETLRFTAAAKERLFEWQRSITDLCNANNEALMSIYAKMEMCAARFALCIQMMYYACGEGNKQFVDMEAVEGAIKLVEYFTNTAIKVHSIISDSNPLVQLPMNKQSLFDSLPESFSTKEGIDIANVLGMPERTFKNFIANRNLFNRIKQGQYEKLL